MPPVVNFWGILQDLPTGEFLDVSYKQYSYSFQAHIIIINPQTNDNSSFEAFR